MFAPLAALLVGAAGVVATASPVAAADWPAGVKVLPSGTVKVFTPGTVLDGKDISGGLYILANDVTIRNSRVSTNGAYYAIRVPAEVSNARIERVQVACTSPDANGVAFGNYSAIGVTVSGCKNAFITNARTSIVDSWADGVPVGSVPAAASVPPPAPKPAGGLLLPPAPAPAPAPAAAPVPAPSPPAAPLLAPVTPPGPATGDEVGSEPAVAVPADFAAVKRGAGVKDKAALRPSGAITVKTPGAVVANLDVAGSISVNADNVTIRNVRVKGSSSTALVKIARGVRGTTIEDCTVVVTSAGANGAIGYLGYDTTVRRCDISGYADGIKVESGGVYEYNYIHMSKPAGSAKHLDGIQGSGDTNYTIRHNVIDADVARGGNAAVFVQAWNGAKNSHVSNVVVEGNYLLGGNYTAYLQGGKKKDGSDPASWVHKYRLAGNTFGSTGYRYGMVRVDNCTETTIVSNTVADGSPFKAPCP